MHTSTRHLKLGLTLLVLGSVFAYGIYLARLTYSGYCHAAGKYLTDDEKIRVALVDLLKKYPPAVIRTPVSYGWTLDVPKHPIYYSDVDEFLSLNPDCCKVKPTAAFMEGVRLTVLDRLTGAATNNIAVNYLVRYRNDDNTEHAIKTLSHLHITSCGSSGTPWTP